MIYFFERKSMQQKRSDPFFTMNSDMTLLDLVDLRKVHCIIQVCRYKKSHVIINNFIYACQL